MSATVTFTATVKVSAAVISRLGIEVALLLPRSRVKVPLLGSRGEVSLLRLLLRSEVPLLRRRGETSLLVLTTELPSEVASGLLRRESPLLWREVALLRCLDRRRRVVPVESAIAAREVPAIVVKAPIVF